MKIIQTEVYTFDELSDKAKEVARKWFSEFVCDDALYVTKEDALQIGFDIDNLQTFEIDSVDCANRIVKEHGNSCETYKLAKMHLDGTLNSVEFERALIWAYSNIYSQNYKHMLSNEYIDLNIISNEYTFTIDGKRFG